MLLPTDDTCVQPHYFAHVAAFIAQQTGLHDVNFSSSSSQSITSESRPAPSPAAAVVSDKAGVSEPPEEGTPLSTAPGSPNASSSSEGGSSSFEFIDASTEDLLAEPRGGEEGGAAGIVGAGSLGPKEEVEEVLREAKDELRRQKL